MITVSKDFVAARAVTPRIVTALTLGRDNLDVSSIAEGRMREMTRDTKERVKSTGNKSLYKESEHPRGK